MLFGPGVGHSGSVLVVGAGYRPRSCDAGCNVCELALTGWRLVAGWRVFAGRWWCLFDCSVAVRFRVVLVSWSVGRRPLYWVAGLAGVLVHR